MTQQELIKRLKGLRCWVQQDSVARNKLDELIQLLGG